METFLLDILHKVHGGARQVLLGWLSVADWSVTGSRGAFIGRWQEGAVGSQSHTTGEVGGGCYRGRENN